MKKATTLREAGEGREKILLKNAMRLKEIERMNRENYDKSREVEKVRNRAYTQQRSNEQQEREIQ